MRLVIIAGILLAAAFWLVVGDSGSRQAEVARQVEIAKSSRTRMVDGSDRPGYGQGGRGGFEHFRGAVSGFSEDELLKMAEEEVASNDQEALWRHAAIWERLGELRSEKAIDLLITERKGSEIVYLFTDSINDLAALSLVGGWAASGNSLGEIKETLFPQLQKLKDAGFQGHERALGREMARFDPMAAWNMLAGDPDGDSPLIGGDYALSGLIQGLVGKAELSQLMPLIQFRQSSDFRFAPVEVVLPNQVLTSSGFLSFDPPVAPDGGEILVSPIEPQAGSNQFEIVRVVDPREPHLFSEAVGVMMISHPDAAKGYLENAGLLSFEAQTADPDKVWKTMAKLDPEASMNLLRDSDFEVYAPGIAKGLIATAPERLSEVVEIVTDPDQQAGLISAAIRTSSEVGIAHNYPMNPQAANWSDREGAIQVIENVIESSAIDESTRADLRKQLKSSQAIPVIPHLPSGVTFDFDFSTSTPAE